VESVAEMITENLTHLVSLVTSVPSLSASAGLAVGGKGSDPGMIKIPLPAAWVMYTKDDVDEPPYGKTNSDQPGIVGAVQAVLATCSVLIYLPYSTQDDLLTVQFPLLESVIKAVHGKEAPSYHRWRYIGQKLALVYPDRIAYEQHYTLSAML
jgi:hypothetical protein